MALSAKLQLRQSQSLVMTPQLMQSIRLLQFTHLELERFIDDEIEKNPLLERPELQADEPAVELLRPMDDGEAATTAIDHMFEAADAGAETLAERLDTSMENVFPDDSGPGEPSAPDLTSEWRSAEGGSGGSGGEGFDIEDMAQAKVSLFDHVGEQIAFGFRHPGDLLIAGELADALDEGGYMRASVADIAERLGTDVEDVLAVLVECQAFDPPGLFARNLSECLAAQLRVRDRFDPAMQAMVSNLE